MTPQEVASRFGPTLTDALLDPLVSELTAAGCEVTVTREEDADGVLRIWVWHPDWWNTVLLDNLVELTYERQADGSWRSLY